MIARLKRFKTHIKYLFVCEHEWKAKYYGRRVYNAEGFSARGSQICLKCHVHKWIDPQW